MVCRFSSAWFLSLSLFKTSAGPCPTPTDETPSISPTPLPPPPPPTTRSSLPHTFFKKYSCSVKMPLLLLLLWLFIFLCAALFPVLFPVAHCHHCFPSFGFPSLSCTFPRKLPTTSGRSDTRSGSGSESHRIWVTSGYYRGFLMVPGLGKGGGGRGDGGKVEREKDPVCVCACVSGCVGAICVSLCVYGLATWAGQRGACLFFLLESGQWKKIVLCYLLHCLGSYCLFSLNAALL